MDKQFTSNEVVALTGITPRQLQWWDERGIVVPAREGHRRLYSMGDVAEVAVICEWSPEYMEPGTIFVLENAGEVGEKEDPYWAVLSCPDCGTLGLITRKQIAGLLPVICGSGQCSAQFFINDSDIVPRKAF